MKVENRIVSAMNSLLQGDHFRVDFKDDMKGNLKIILLHGDNVVLSCAATSTIGEGCTEENSKEEFMNKLSDTLSHEIIRHFLFDKIPSEWTSANTLLDTIDDIKKDNKVISQTYFKEMHEHSITKEGFDTNYPFHLTDEEELNLFRGQNNAR